MKDPKKRPSSEKLLRHHFFKRTRSNDFLSRAILDGLPPLGERFRILKVSNSIFISSFFKIFIFIMLAAYSLVERVRHFCYACIPSFFQTKEADLLVQNKAMYGDKEQLSQVSNLSSSLH